MGSRTELSSFPGSDSVTNCVVRTGSGNGKRMGGRGSFEEAKGENWDSGFESSRPWQAGTQTRGRREVGWRDTGSGSIQRGLWPHRGAFGGCTTGSCPLPAGGQLGLGSRPSLLQSVEAALERGQGREAQEGKGPRLRLPGRKMLKIQSALPSTNRGAGRGPGALRALVRLFLSHRPMT